MHETFEQMGQAFEGLFQDEATPTDPRLVVERMAELIAMAPGARPLRSVVGVDFGVNDLNAATAPIQAGLFDGMGLTGFTTLASR